MESLSPRDESQGTVDQAGVRAAGGLQLGLSHWWPPSPVRMPPALGPGLSWVKPRELLFSLHGGGSRCHDTLGRGLAWETRSATY